MTFKTDGGGFAFKCNDAKISTYTWGTKLSQLSKQTGIVRIITYSLPDLDYVRKQFERRPYDIFLIAHTKFSDRARQIKRLFPDIRIAVHDEVHSKLLLIEPHTVYISSANFGNSTWHEMAVGFHSKEAHDYCVTCFDVLWNECCEVTPCMTYGQAVQLVNIIQTKFPVSTYSGLIVRVESFGSEYIVGVMGDPIGSCTFSSHESWERFLLREKLNHL